MKESSYLWETLKENSVVILLYFFVWIEFIQVVYLYEKIKRNEQDTAVTTLMTEAVEIDKENNKVKKVKVKEIEKVDKDDN